MFSDRDSSMPDAFALGANNLLPRRGADIVALFGVGKGVDYAGVIDKYIDPSTSTSSTDYLPALSSYLQTLGYPAMTSAQAWLAFGALPADLQHIFVDKVLMSEIGLANQLGSAVGYAIINTMFPGALGYTLNGLPSDDFQAVRSVLTDYGFGDQQLAQGLAFLGTQGYTVTVAGSDFTARLVNGAYQPVVSGVLSPLTGDALAEFDAKVSGALGTPAGLNYISAQASTGSLDLLHATIKTLQSASVPITATDGTQGLANVGGNVLVLGPGGDINVGTTALELNKKLSNSSLGILTLDNGAIDVFTDANVLVNQSRILTVQGGDVLMWSSNGDLDAGRGAKTTVDFKPLSVIFDPADLQTINLTGLVSGAGIGTIRSTPDAPTASATLLAPHGIVNAGDAGLRSSGNLDILALIILNASNIAAVGSVSGVPQANEVNLGSLESASSTAGSATKAVTDAISNASQAAISAVSNAVSIITVDLLGFQPCNPEDRRCHH
jgi:hypothetical protein